MTEHYQAYFCEENIWHLASRMSGVVMFISNPQNQFAIWKQKLAEQDGQEELGPIEPYILWDYHVVFAHGPKEPAHFQSLIEYISQTGCLIHDFDTLLPNPCQASRYLSESFPLHKYSIAMNFQPRFRLIEAKEYVDRFWSDRSHMRNEQQEWSALPPSWPCILSQEEEPLRLTELMNFSETENEIMYELRDFRFSEQML